MNALLNSLVEASNQSTTLNGATTNTSSLDPVLDFFFVGPVAKKNSSQVIPIFSRAYSSDREMALRCLQWVRDVRGGAGARMAFRQCLNWLIHNKSKDAIAILDKTAEIGRWDDILIGLNGPRHVQDHVIKLVKNGLMNPTTAPLVAKWLPREVKIKRDEFTNAIIISKRKLRDAEYVSKLRSGLRLSPAKYRKLLAQKSSTVEQQMCANDWNLINYSHVPSVASARYRNAFKTHDPVRYAQFVEAAVKGEVKINAAAIFPHDVLSNISVTSGYNLRVSETIRNAVNAQWKNLPNYMSNDKNVLVVADVSGSMQTVTHGNTNALKICIAMAMYFAERINGPFKDYFFTFSSNPTLQHLVGDDIISRIDQLAKAHWSQSTDLQKTFDVLLTHAMINKVEEKDMPSTILILSDMEFNVACYHNHTNLDVIRDKYAAAGYKMPGIVFWNLKGRIGNVPATANQKDVALVSGFSPAIVSSVFDCDNLSPINVMLQALMNKRYDIRLS